MVEDYRMARSFFSRLEGNSRGCLAFEPFFLIPFNIEYHKL